MRTGKTQRNRKNMFSTGIIMLLVLLSFALFGIVLGVILLNDQKNALPASQTQIGENPIFSSTVTTYEATSTTTSTSTNTPTETWTPTPTEFVVSIQNIGESIQGRTIDMTCLGSGDQILVVISGIHGDEIQPRYFVNQIVNYFTNNQSVIPAEARLCGLANMNPDGAASNPAQRFNANYVDLNRNWDTSDWVADIERGNGILDGGGGSAPLSEPENMAVAQFLLDMQATSEHPLIVIFYHSTIQQFSDVRPGYTIQGNSIIWGPLASSVAQQFAEQVNYEYLHAYEYAITGESLHWMADHGIVAVGVEMPDSGNYSDITIADHTQALIHLLMNWPKITP